MFHYFCNVQSNFMNKCANDLFTLQIPLHQNFATASEIEM